MIRGGHGQGFVIVVMWVLYLGRFVIRQVRLVLWIALYYILLFERLKEFY